jgi:hypothetical protein
MLRARPIAPLAAGFVAGIAIALLPGAWIPLAAAGTLAAALSIRWRHPALLLVLGLGLGGLRQHAADLAPARPATPDPLEGRLQGPPRIYRSLADPNRESEEDGSFVVGNVQVRYFRKHVPLIGGERVISGRIEERGVEELLMLPDVRARVLLLPHHGKSHRQHRELVQRVAPEIILVSAPEGYSSPKVLEALPFAPRVAGREGAIEIELK